MFPSIFKLRKICNFLGNSVTNNSVFTSVPVTNFQGKTSESEKGSQQMLLKFKEIKLYTHLHHKHHFLPK